MEPEWTPWSPPDWPTILREARARGHFTAAEKRAARDWVSCAVGEARFKQPTAILVEGHYSRPQDSTLLDLGMEFNHYVRDDTIALAETIYELIQRRVAELTAWTPSPLTQA